jgi:hypothetical protein
MAAITLGIEVRTPRSIWRRAARWFAIAALLKANALLRWSER